MVITPVQFAVSSAITQKGPLSSSSTTPAITQATDTANTTAATETPAIVPSVSSKLIQVSSLYNATLNLAGTSSQLSTATVGSQQITRILQNLRNIAAQIANSQGAGASLNQLEAEFQSLFAQIDQAVNEANFNGTNLLDGSFSLDSSAVGQDTTAQAATTLAIPNLGTRALFGSNSPSVKTPQGAAAAIASIDNAQGTVDGVNSNIEDVSNQLNFTIASMETIQANVFASTSTLTEGDVTSGLAGFITSLLSKPGSSANAQTGKISDKLLNLVDSGQAS